MDGNISRLVLGSISELNYSSNLNEERADGFFVAFSVTTKLTLSCGEVARTLS